MNRPGRFVVSCIACWALSLVSAPAQQNGKPEGGALTLKEAIELTVSRAPEIAIADAQIARSGEVLRETRSANRPQVVTGTGLAYNNGFPLSIEGSAPSAIQIGVTQSIFSKRNKNLILEAEEGIKADRIGSDRIRNELAVRTALVYYELHHARKLEALWSQRLEMAAKDQRLTETLLEAGKARPLDVTLAKTITANAEQQLLVARERARLSETELRGLTGRQDGPPLQTVEPQFDVTMLGLPGDVLYQKAVEAHPEILQAESNLRAKEFHLEAEKGGKYPRIDLVSQYALFTRFNNYQDYFNRFTRNNYLIGMSIQVPLFDGFQSSARIAQGRQDITEARLRLERAKTNLRMNIERSLSALRIAKGATELARRELEAAREGARVSQTLLEAGRISPKETLGPQNLVREKEIALLDAEKSLFEREVELLQITGTAASAI
jgi:outer membrane protein TolC